MSLNINHDAARHRFETVEDGTTAYVEYAEHDGVMSINHTIVPSQIGGRGIAAALVKASLDDARARGLKVVAACSYADSYIGKHPEYEDLRKQG